MSYSYELTTGSNARAGCALQGTDGMDFVQPSRRLPSTRDVLVVGLYVLANAKQSHMFLTFWGVNHFTVLHNPRNCGLITLRVMERE